MKVTFSFKFSVLQLLNCKRMWPLALRVCKKFKNNQRRCASTKQVESRKKYMWASLLDLQPYPF